MVSWLLLILSAVYFYQGYLKRRMDRRKLSHSSYYDVAYGGEKKCVDQAAAVLKDVGGYGRILFHWHYFSENGPAAADVILLHETGVYVLETKDYQGWISGNLEEEYWVQTMGAGRYSSYQNYFYNPVLKLSGCIACMKRELPDMKWLPYYSLAVFGNGCELENAGLSDSLRKIIQLKQLSYTMYGMIRASRTFLSRQVIDEIYERLQGMETAKNLSSEAKNLSFGVDKNAHLYYS
ncbi:MAG TPA: NERD domain-containing protein [Candidatus Eisenbergiella merdipullorum]|uniref:NERD domain-containing protein n=1 Tax=Candidatus Eisenbergiella merdipullorum TaxID=2838553 RepID=A0A9D2I8C0_9FIRM|nr:NERD domain-containing protein [Candidatus Eisenbergiella merdipullorum]